MLLDKHWSLNIDEMLVHFPSVCLFLFCKPILCYVSPLSVRLSVTGYVSPLSVRLSVPGYVSPLSFRLSVTGYVSTLSVRLSVTGGRWNW